MKQPIVMIGILLSGEYVDMPGADLLKRRRVHQAAVGPQGIQPAFDFEWRVDADIALEHFTVVADHFDDVVGPLLVQAEGFAVAGAHAEETLDFGVFAVQHLIDVFGGDAEVFRFDECHGGKIDDVVPLVIPMADSRPYL